MAKKGMAKEYIEEFEDDEFDYSDTEMTPDDDMLAEAMERLVEMSHQQTMLAIELTKVITSKVSDAAMNEDKIFEIFKKASQIIHENSPLKTLVECK